MARLEFELAYYNPAVQRFNFPKGINPKVNAVEWLEFELSQRCRNPERFK